MLTSSKACTCCNVLIISLVVAMFVYTIDGRRPWLCRSAGSQQWISLRGNHNFFTLKSRPRCLSVKHDVGALQRYGADFTNELFVISDLCMGFMTSSHIWLCSSGGALLSPYSQAHSSISRRPEQVRTVSTTKPSRMHLNECSLKQNIYHHLQWSSHGSHYTPQLWVWCRCVLKI